MMEADFLLYCRQCKDLATSIVLKNDFAVTAINNDLLSRGETIDEGDPKTWKYYLNLNGQYFVGNSPSENTSDQVMRVTKVEDGLEMDYTKDNLAANPLTKLSFDSFKDLIIADNPLQENLVYRINYPIDMDAAIDAEDYQILYYDESLVASNEITLMEKVQQWIYNFKDRWYKEDFQISDPYYVGAFLITLYHRLPKVIMDLRLAACGTPEVSQFHLWNYLADHYELNKYSESLSLSQALWLYRNIVDLQRNTGKQWVLDELIKNIAEPKGLKAYKFDFILRQNESLLEGRPVGEFLKREMNDNIIDLDNQPTEDPLNVLSATSDKALKNAKELAADQEELQYRTSYEQLSELATGLIEFEASSNGLAEVTNTVRLKIEYWLYLASLDRYDNNITVEVPNSGSVTLDMKDAFILYEYARFARNGIELDIIKPYTAMGVVNYDPSLSVTSFRDVVPEEYVSDDFINETLADRIPAIIVNTPSSLEQYVEFITQRRIRHKLSIDYINSLHSRAHHINVIDGVYSLAKCELVADGTSYNDWLASKKIAKFSMTNSDWDLVMSNVLLQCTGISPDNTGIGVSKKDMIEIIDRITSYNVLVVNGNSNADEQEIEYVTIHPDTGTGSKEATIYSDMANIRILDTEYGLDSKEASVDVDPTIVEFDTKPRNVSELLLDVTMDVEYSWTKAEPVLISIPDINFIEN